MPISALLECQSVHCQSPGEHPDKKIHGQINLVASRLDEKQRCWFVAVEANRVGQGGVRLLSQITGMDEKTIERGREELEQNLWIARPSRCILGVAEDHGSKKDPAIESTLQEIIEPETAGNLMSEQKWVRSSLRHLSKELCKGGHPACPKTVPRLLKKADYSLKVNSKKLADS